MSHSIDNIEEYKSSKIGKSLILCTKSKKVNILESKYTNEQKEESYKLYKDGNSIRKIANILNIPKTTVNRWIKNKGIIRSSIYHSSNYYKNIKNNVINEYKSGIYYKTIAEKYDISPKTVHLWCRQSNATNHRGIKSYVENIHWFQNIDCEEKAYFLGFLFADGYIGNKDNNQYDIRFELKYEDKYILDEFVNVLKIKNKTFTIEQNKNNVVHKYYRIQFNCKEMVEDLYKYGLIYKKNNRKEIKNINHIFIRHFLRGYFDGDGCLDNDCIISICAHDDFAMQLKNIFCKYGFLCKIKKKSNISIVVLSAKQKKKIYQFFYGNASIYLKRKKEKFDNLLTKYK